MRSVGIPKDSMPISKFLRHAELVPSRFGASCVLVGKLVKINGDNNLGSVRVGDVVTLAQMPAAGEPPSWEPENVVHVRVDASR